MIIIMNNLAIVIVINTTTITEKAIDSKTCELSIRPGMNEII